MNREHSSVFSFSLSRAPAVLAVVLYLSRAFMFLEVHHTSHFLKRDSNLLLEVLVKKSSLCVCV